MSSDADTSTTPHRCHAQDCPTEVPPEMFMCPPHWSMVPAALRDSLNKTMAFGQGIDDTPPAEYLAFAKAAIAESPIKRRASAAANPAHRRNRYNSHSSEMC